MSDQISSHIVMVRPASFGFNQETAADNAFQVNDTRLSKEEIKNKAVEEFDKFVAALRREDVNIIVIQDINPPANTDAVFPNNWVSFHHDGTAITYPMFATARRTERREEIIMYIGDIFTIKRRIHMEDAEEEEKFLEGTGSMILDRVNRIVYACRSERTNEEILEEFCETMNFDKVLFDAVDKNGIPLYHTNVMMAMGEEIVIICLEIIPSEAERNQLKERFEAAGKDLLEISYEQMLNFAGNMLQVKSRNGQSIMAMSTRALNSLRDGQIRLIEKHSKIVHSDLQVIETYGGGSARCMMAEVFLPEL